VQSKAANLIYANCSVPDQGLQSGQIFTKGTGMKKKATSAFTALAFLALSSFASAEDRARFQLSSTTFEDGATMPISTIYNYLYNGANVCSIDGSAGGDESPELSWKHAPRGTRTFAIVLFDETAGVVHWGIHNISGLEGSADFPPTALSLSEKLVESRDHILASASITGLYSTTPPQ
jgi:phosphatidylethanolamine-binding protein (PEBP) family uncharacterized protein